MTIDWLDLFDQEGVEFVVLDPSDDGNLIKMLRDQPGWAIGLEDEEAVIFARVTEPREPGERRFQTPACGLTGADKATRRDRT